MTASRTRITVLHHDDCPHWRSVLDVIGHAVIELGLDATITHEVADASSPTILVDGVDLFPAGAQSVATSCRLYVTPVGLRGVPADGQVRAALAECGAGMASESDVKGRPGAAPDDVTLSLHCVHIGPAPPIRVGGHRVYWPRAR